MNVILVAQKQMLGDLRTYLAIEMSQYNASINSGYIWMNFGYFRVFGEYFFEYTFISLTSSPLPLANPDEEAGKSLNPSNQP